MIQARPLDHIATEDYYSLAGIFFSTRLVPGPVPGNTPLVRVPLLPATEIRTLEAQAERDKHRIVELTRQVQTAEDREYVASLEAKVTAALPVDLPVALDYFHSTLGLHPATTTEFAATHFVDPRVLERWVLLLRKQPAFTALTDMSAVEERVAQLTAVARKHRDQQERDPITGSIAAAQILQFRADDRWIQCDSAGRVILWPDRAPSADDAAPPQDEPGPRLAYAVVQGTERPVLRFDGDAILETPRIVPTTGALFAVFRPEPGAAGTRLLGWEDSAGGQHGVGLMLMADGGLHAILRRAGVSGDVVAPGAGNPEFQLISLTWGSGGVVLFRNGEAIGSNTSINSISADPTIAALHIGGPGSGVGQRFRGDLCELRICAGDLDEVARKRVESELRDRWLVPDPEQTGFIQQDPLSELYDELLSPRSPYWTDVKDREKAFSDEVRQRLAAERAELESLTHKPAVEIPRAVVVQDGGPPGTKHEGFHDAHVFLRGNPANPGKLVPRGFPHALAGEDPPQIQSGSGRRELARWLTLSDNPLTARVMVNRLWQHHFGEGLVRTSTNFGHRGELPSHPELLDYLATRFVESGWSIKAMHRLIILSSVYQQSSESRISNCDNAQAERHGEVHTDSRSADPENRLLAQMKIVSGCCMK